MQELEYNVSAIEITSNLADVSKGVDDMIETYSGLIVTDDSIQTNKKLCADINKVSAQINDAKIQVKKACLEKYADFESEVKQLISKVDGLRSEVADQIKEFEALKKLEKLTELRNWFDALNHPLVEYGNIHDNKYLNLTFSVKKAKEEILSTIQQIDSDIESLKKYDDHEALLVIYKDSGFSYRATMDKIDEIERLKLNKEVKPVIESNDIVESCFRVVCESSKLKRLVKFMRDNEIEFEGVKSD
jgi:hypothetical protein